MAKRIVVCADGTWNDPEDENPTNVLRVARAIRPVATDGTEQIVFYDWGVGADRKTLFGGAFGEGLEKNVQDGYRFIVQNFRTGDEIYLFGFSRGAYTVRSLAGLLNKCGILKRTMAADIPKAFDYYKRKKTRPSDPEARQWRQDRAVGGRRGAVRFLGVWDTVGALGIPDRMFGAVDEKHLFHDVGLGGNVSVARHALAIDEKRADFKPTLWDPRDSVDLLQVWFAGFHTDVGGSTRPDRGGFLASDVPLKWMMRQAHDAGLRFEPHLKQSLKPSHVAKLHQSHKGFYKVLGKHHRVIPDTTFVHRTVQQRKAQIQGWKPEALTRWLEARNQVWGELVD